MSGQIEDLLIKNQKQAIDQAKIAAFDQAKAAEERRVADLVALQEGYNRGALEGLHSVGITPQMLMAANTAQQYEDAGRYQAGMDQVASPVPSISSNSTSGTRMSQLDDPRGNIESPEAAAYRAKIAENKAGNGLYQYGIK